MSYTPPAAAFVDNSAPVGGGVGPSLSAGFFNTLVAGVKDADNRITALDGAVVHRGEQVVNVRDYGAVGNAKYVSNCAITAGQTTLTSAANAFTNITPGMFVAVAGAGAAAGAPLITTVAVANDFGTITLSAAAVTTVTAATVQVGTDDTTAIQNALNAGQPLYFAKTGSGSYLAGTLTLPNEATLSGPNGGIIFNNWGRAARLMLKAGTNAPLLQGDSTGAQAVIIRDLKLDGAKDFQTTAAALINQPDIATATEVHWLIDNVLVTNSAGDGIYLGKNNRGSQVTRSWSYTNTGCGIHVKSSDCQILNNFVGANTSYGILCEDGAWDTQIIGNNIWSNRAAVNLLFVKLAWLIGNFIDSNKEHGVNVTGCAATVINGNVFGGNNANNGSFASLQFDQMTDPASVSANSFPAPPGGGTILPSYDIFTGTTGAFIDGGNSRASGSSTNGFTNNLPRALNPIRGQLTHTGSTAGFFGATPGTKPTVTGSRGGNAALASLLTQLATLGLITDSTTV